MTKIRANFRAIFAKKLGLFSQNFRAKIRTFKAVFKQNSAHRHNVSNLKAFTSSLKCTDKVTEDFCIDVIEYWHTNGEIKMMNIGTQMVK